MKTKNIYAVKTATVPHMHTSTHENLVKTTLALNQSLSLTHTAYNFFFANAL